ncbi:MAG TPA: ABC transporter substrate-binding protein [Stellaceae bacterium]|nr:ABC transporter substrate-binding protein [Stellaceae bacterium]
MTRHPVRSAAFLVLLVLFFAKAAGAETVKLGLLKTTSAGPLYLAVDKGYFAAEGLDARLVTFDAAQPVAVAVVSGDVDFGVTGLTAGFYNLAGQGALKIIGAQGREAPGFHSLAFLESNRAYEAGLTSLDGLGGHTVALTQTGTPAHYALGQVALKHGVALGSIHILTLQSVPNIVSALTGGQTDLGGTIVTVPMMGAIERGDLRILAWVSDEIAFQDRAIFVSTHTADENRGLIERFFRAFRKGAQAYHDALIGPDEKPRDGPGAADAIAIIAKYTGQAPETVKLGIAYSDPSLRVDVADVLRQIAWYKSQGMVKPDVDGNTIIDSRYVVPLPSP